MLEQVGHRLDREAERCYVEARALGLEGMDITRYIDQHIDLARVLRSASPMWDGGYVICGLTGSGESFALRDPWGIRPAFWYQDDEVCVLASERPVIQTAFNVSSDCIRELEPGEALLISQAGQVRTEQVNAPRERSACSFERIYFSRGSDADIYQERKMLGRELVPQVLKAIDEDVDHTVFSFIPNTAESAFFGMAQGLDEWLNEQKARAIAALGPKASPDELSAILSRRIRREKVAVKDIKLRTFITESNSRDDLAAHVYDITYGTVRPEVDNLVVIDDSIVRGTTLRQSIIGILARLRPKKIVMVSSSPQVRYPDYYGIDMSRLSEFIAFRAAVALLKERGMEDIIVHAREQALAQRSLPREQWQNCVAQLYAPFTPEELSAKMAQLLTPADVDIPVEIVYQSIDGLHAACPQHTGDWYFSGQYPTPGGVRLLNETFLSQEY
jgi:amidophosphoribosyltransferase